MSVPNESILHAELTLFFVRVQFLDRDRSQTKRKISRFKITAIPEIKKKTSSGVSFH